ncbi:hypothetical protein [Methylovulum psychrotolerans]|uniref:hypothetical protein n=1 Tax=Methylovulum psychrotolerans TaxID=1704499 RepID=UPI0012FC1BF1|nr:hypothetical protein [Methylovulum psychrotolerans]
MSPKKPHFITATHYFGRCSMGNFWNTFECGRVPDDFKQIRADGFNAIILIVPWAHLQPHTQPIEYDQTILGRLSYLLAQARAVGLRIMLRLGYLWENAPADMTTYRRYQRLLTDPQLQLAWQDYLAKVESVVGEDAQDCNFFLSWEDAYWPVLRHPENLRPEARIKYAQDIGLTAYIKKRFAFKQLQALYDVTADSYDTLPAPTSREKLFAEFALFFDREYIEPWILASKNALVHDIWYEHRIDPDVFYGDGWQDSVEYGSYKTGSSCDVIYYHPKIGVSGAKPLSADEAAKHMQRVLNGFRPFNIHKKPVFLDQFNFKINNPKHPDFARLADEHVPRLLEQLVPLFKKNLIGYGVWGYRDWRDDKIFNGAFELGLAGWEGTQLIMEGDTVLLTAGSELKQANLPPMPFVYIECLPLPGETVLSISNGVCTEQQTVTADTCEIILTFAQNNTGKGPLHINCLQGTLSIRKVAYYSHIYSNGMRDINGAASPILNAIARFNHTLAPNLPTAAHKQAALPA